MAKKNDIAFPISINGPSPSISVEHYGFHVDTGTRIYTYKKGCTITSSTSVNINALYSGSVKKTASSEGEDFKIGDEENTFTFNEEGFVFIADYLNFEFDDKDYQQMLNFNPLTKQRFYLIFEGTFTIEDPPENGFNKSDKIASCSSTFTVYGITKDGRYFDPIKHILELLQDNNTSIDNRFKNDLKIYSPTLIKHNTTINVIGGGTATNGNLTKVDNEVIFFNNLPSNTSETVIWIVDSTEREINISEKNKSLKLTIIGNANKPALTGNELHRMLTLSMDNNYKFDLELNGLEFIKGKSENYGGALSCEELNFVLIKNCKFTNNCTTSDGTKSSFGGAIYFSKCKSICISADVTKQNFMEIKSLNKIKELNSTINVDVNEILNQEKYTSFIGNNSSTNGVPNFGSAIYVEDSDIILKNCNFQSNDSDDYCTSGTVFIKESRNDGSISIIDSIFIGNKICAGGALAISSRTDIAFLLGKGSLPSVVQNALEAFSDLNHNAIKVKNSFFYQNCASEEFGGAIVTSHVKSEIINSVFIGNNTSADNGGAIAAFMASNLTLDNNIFYKNFCEQNTINGGGGALYASVGVGSKNGGLLININNSIFRENYTNQDAGALRFTGGVKATINNSKFLKNKAAYWGGAISFRSSILNIENCTFKQNSANKGGAIYGGGYLVSPKDYSPGYYLLTTVLDSSLSIQDSSFIQNTAAIEGTSIFVVRDWVMFADDFIGFILKKSSLDFPYDVEYSCDQAIIAIAGFDEPNEKRIFSYIPQDISISLNQSLFRHNIPFSIQNCEINRYTNQKKVFSLINSNSVKAAIKNALTTSQSDNILEITPPVEDVEVTSSYIKEEEL